MRDRIKFEMYSVTLFSNSNLENNETA